MIGVIKMKTYKIYKINQNVADLLEQYPEITAKIISLEPKNIFFTKQMECLFDSNDGVSDFIEYKLNERYDYERDHNIHTINNQLTKDKITCTIFDYYIIIEAAKKSNIFMDILYQISKSYVIMSEQIDKLEV